MYKFIAILLTSTLSYGAIRYVQKDRTVDEVAVGLPFRLLHAIEIIEDTFGDTVHIKPKTLLKYGSRDDIGTSYVTLAKLGSGEANETFVSTNAIDKISSSNAGDTTTVVVEGHTIDANGDFRFTVQTVTLQGQTETALTTPLARATRAYASGATNLLGTVYIYEDDTVSAGVPQTASKVHLTIPAGENQTFKAATTISYKDYWLITQACAAVNKKTAAVVDMAIQVRLQGKVFRTAAVTSISSTGSNNQCVDFDPVVIVPKNSDVRLIAKANTTAVEASGWINGYLALVED